MRELIRTNDIVLIGYVESLLKDAEIHVMILDQNMSVMEGSIGVLPRRILVSDADFEQAKTLLQQSDLGQWIRDDAKS